METKSNIRTSTSLILISALVFLPLGSWFRNESVFASLLEDNLQAGKNNPAGQLMMTPEICNNGIDDNGNGLVDANDPDCAKQPMTPEICNNGIDDNGNGLVDANDPDCANTTSSNEQAQPLQGIDTNRPGLILGKDISKGNSSTAQPSNDNEAQVTQKQSDIVMQAMQDDQLVERIFPLILKKLDGPTLLKMMDGTQLLEKILPYVKIKITEVSPKPSTVYRSCLGAIINSCGKDPGFSTATCGPDDGVAVGGGFEFNQREGDIDLNSELSSTNGWFVHGLFDETGDIGAKVLCMKLEVQYPSGGVNVR